VAEPYRCQGVHDDARLRAECSMSKPPNAPVRRRAAQESVRRSPSSGPASAFKRGSSPERPCPGQDPLSPSSRSACGPWPGRARAAG
jgi:hypothetical protein